MRNDYSTFERIWNVQILALQTVFICLLSLPFLCVSYLCDVMLFTMTWSVTCPLTLCNITEHRHVKCPVHFFRWNNFSSPVWSTRKSYCSHPGRQHLRSHPLLRYSFMFKFVKLDIFRQPLIRKHSFLDHIFSQSSDFALYLEDYLIYEHHTLES